MGGADDRLFSSAFVCEMAGHEKRRTAPRSSIAATTQWGGPPGLLGRACGPWNFMKNPAGASMTSRCELYQGTALAVPRSINKQRALAPVFSGRQADAIRRVWWFFDPAFLLPGGAVAYCRDSLRIGRQDSAALRVLLERALRKEGRVEKPLAAHAGLPAGSGPPSTR